MLLQNIDDSEVVDLHVHVGQWNDSYFVPLDLARQLLDEEGIYGIGISSLSACKNTYNMNEIIEEIKPLLTRYPGRIFHWLWLHPMAVPKNLHKATYGCPVHGLKLHPYAQDWNEKAEALRLAFVLAQRERLPMLIHTGNDLCCEAGAFEEFICEFQDVDVVLAHARPIEQALQLAMEYENVWFDTAFVSRGSLIHAVDAGLISRFLIGSDFPITKHYGEKKYSDSYKNFKGILVNNIVSATKAFFDRYNK